VGPQRKYWKKGHGKLKAPGIAQTTRSRGKEKGTHSGENRWDQPRCGGAPAATMNFPREKNSPPKGRGGAKGGRGKNRIVNLWGGQEGGEKFVDWPGVLLLREGIGGREGEVVVAEQENRGSEGEQQSGTRFPGTELKKTVRASGAQEAHTEGSKLGDFTPQND